MCYVKGVEKLAKLWWHDAEKNVWGMQSEDVTAALNLWNTENSRWLDAGAWA
jgi:hypothetical protein